MEFFFILWIQIKKIYHNTTELKGKKDEKNINRCRKK